MKYIPEENWVDISGKKTAKKSTTFVYQDVSRKEGRILDVRITGGVYWIESVENEMWVGGCVRSLRGLLLLTVSNCLFAIYKYEN